MCSAKKKIISHFDNAQGIPMSSKFYKEVECGLNTGLVPPTNNMCGQA